MLPHFEHAIVSLGETVAWERGSGKDRDPALGTNVADFLLAVHKQMPDYLRPPFHMLVLLFDIWPLPRKGRFFHQLSLDERLIELDSWRRARLEFRRRFVEFYASLSVFGLYSDLYGQDYQHGSIRSEQRAKSG